MTTRRKNAAKTPTWAALLPQELLALPLARLALAPATLAAFADHHVRTVGEALAAPVHKTTGAFTDGRDRELAQALARALHDGTAQFSTAAHDWPTLRAQLLGPLGDDERQWLEQLVGFEHEPPPLPALARSLGLTAEALDERAEQVRTALATNSSALLARMHHEAAADLAAYDGILRVEHAAVDTVVHVCAKTAADRDLGLRLLAFLFPRECHYHRGVLFGMSPRRYRRLLRTLPGLVPPHRLPLAIDALLDELRALDHRVPRGMLLHLLRSEMHVAIEIDAELGEVAAADSRTPAARLVELLQEAGQPQSCTDLLFAYRERFRAASKAKIVRHLVRRIEFVLIGPDCWALRADHQKELAAVAPLVDKVVRGLGSEVGRHHVADLLPDDARDERTVYYVLDCLVHDPRVRLLGRGDACAATHKRSQVLENLLQALRKASGDIVLGKFLENQPEAQRRLVERLLRHNRLFVQPADDRMDTIANWPFNEERMKRLIAVVQDHLRGRTGYAHAQALKAKLDRSDLGGDWLTVPLLTDVLRRNGPFQILPGNLVASADLDLVGSVRKKLRQALRDAGTAVTVEEVLTERPELGEFAPALRELLDTDPLVQTPDGVHFMLV
jgi:hypothetical protein